MIIKDVKLCPSDNPDCHIVNTDQDLLDRFNSKSNKIALIDKKYTLNTNFWYDIIGKTLQRAYIKDGFIYDDIDIDIYDENIEYINVKCTCYQLADMYVITAYDIIAMSYKHYGEYAQKGDKVRVIKNGLHTSGLVGIVTQFNYDGTTSVRIDDRILRYQHNNLLILEKKGV